MECEVESKVESLLLDSVIREYHVYKDALGELHWRSAAMSS